MTLLRNIASDLLEKRLWPIAAAMIIGLVAVPVMLAKSAGEDPVPLTGAPSTAAAKPKAEAVLALNTAPVGRRARGGKEKNPFKQLFVPKPETIQTGGGGPLENVGSGDFSYPGSAGAVPGSGSPAPSGPVFDPGPSSPSPSPKPAPKPKLGVYKATLRFGQAGTMRTIRDIPRLTPLPSADNPFFVFVGVKSDGRTLVFLVSSDATATGDGKCQPDETCETIELKAGDTEFFDMVTDQGPQQFQMDIVSVRKSTASSAAVARKARARASKAGAALLQIASASSASPDRIGRYRWDAKAGVLKVIPRKKLKAKIAVKAITKTVSVP